MSKSATYSQFKKYVLFAEDFLFKTTLYFIFNKSNEVKTIDNSLKFVMTYDKFKKYLRNLREDAKNSCGTVCQQTNDCPGHQVLKLMEQYENFILDAVQRRGLYYKHVKFIKVKNDSDPMFGFVILPLNEIDIGWKTWSQRLSYLK